VIQLPRYLDPTGFGWQGFSFWCKINSDSLEDVMPMIDASQFTDDELAGYDFMMLNAATSVQHFSQLAIRIWNDVLVELGERGLAEALEGDLSDVTTARIRRSYPLPTL